MTSPDRSASPSDEATERVLSGQVWSDFCDALKKAGEIVLREKSPKDLLDRAEGWRYLSRLTRAALEQSVESGDPAAPQLYRLSHETVKIGADNPDAYYQNAIIDGRYDYVLEGTRGSVAYIGIGTYSGVYGLDSKIEQTGFLDLHGVPGDANGRITIHISKQDKSKQGLWLPMRDDTRLLIVRQFRMDWEKDEVARLQIRCVNAPGRALPPNVPDQLSAAQIAKGLDDAAKFVYATAEIFVGWCDDFEKNPNDVQQKFTGLGDPNNQFWHGYWTLEPGQALVLEAMPPVCDVWNFQLNNYWEESLDYRYFPCHINKHTAKYEKDGSLLIVISAEDPGIGNWMNTAGHRHGTLGLRWTRAIDPQKPKLRVVSLAELKAEAKKRDRA
ncbi:MAG: DUF1214 domain-containing protein [Myxococcota bacterium]